MLTTTLTAFLSHLLYTSDPMVTGIEFILYSLSEFKTRNGIWQFHSGRRAFFSFVPTVTVNGLSQAGNVSVSFF